MSLLSKIIYDVVEDFTGKPISEFNPDSIPSQKRFKFIDSVITKLITELNITPIIIKPQGSIQEPSRSFIGVNHTGTFFGVKVITINNLYPALIGNYPFWNIPNFGEMVKQLKIERTELKREFFVEKNHELKGKITALKIFLNMLYGYITSNNSKLTAFQDANWISNIGYNIMEQISKNPCVLYIDTDTIIATDIPVELSSISFLDYEVETKSVEIIGKKNLRMFEPKNETTRFKNLIEANESDVNFGNSISKTIASSAPVCNLNAKGGIAAVSTEDIRKRASDFAQRIKATTLSTGDVPSNDALKSGVVKYNGDYFFSGEVVYGIVSNGNYLNVIEYDDMGNISREGTVEISQFIDNQLVNT